MEIQFRYVQENGQVVTRKHAFEGIIPNMERRYHETDSSYIQHELAKFLTTQSCLDCKGTRLKETARNVLVGSHNLPQLTAFSITQALNFFNTLKLIRSLKVFASSEIKKLINP